MNLFKKNRLNSQRNGASLLNPTLNETTYAEAYRTLRTNLHFAMADQNFSTLLVTSTGPGEGKTNTVANLAYTIAQNGNSVLMVDCDLRRASLSRMLAKNSLSFGLTNLLTSAFKKPVDALEGVPHNFFDVLHLLEFHKKTGLLTIIDKNYEFHLNIMDGHPLDLQWINQPEERKLSNILVQNGILTTEKLDLALRRQQITGNNLEIIIEQMGILQEEELDSILTVQLTDMLDRISENQDCKFIFHENNSPDLSTQKTIIDTNTLIRQYNPQKLLFLDNTIKETLIKLDDNYFILASGPTPPNPSELISSSCMRFLISRLKKLFDFIIIDSPPILAASDAHLTSSLSDGVLIVIQAGNFDKTTLNRAIDQFRTSGSNIIGAVLNKAEISHHNYTYY